MGIRREEGRSEASRKRVRFLRQAWRSAVYFSVSARRWAMLGVRMEYRSRRTWERIWASLGGISEGTSMTSKYSGDD